MKKIVLLLALFVAGISLPSMAAAAGSFPLKKCIVTDDELGDSPVDITYQGRLIRLCCKSCARKFNANPKKFLAILDREIAAKNKKRL